MSAKDAQPHSGSVITPIGTDAPAASASASTLRSRREAMRDSGMAPSLARGEEPVSRAAYGLDEALVAARRERLAQAPDVHVDSAVLDEHVISPHLVEDLRAPIHAIGVGHEEVQQLELGGAHLERSPGAGHRARGRIEREALD